MIKIDRTSTPCPEPLRSKGEKDLERLRRIDPATLRGKDFRRSIYGSLPVKTALWKMQHGKCCYCEQELERKHSDVEHFRPKTEAVRDDGAADPGYWWLAYRFDNLYFGCRVCNDNKGSRFPLRAGARALQPEEDPRTVVEEAFLIDPGIDDPEQHLIFLWLPGRGYVIAPLDQSKRGRITKEVLDLDRDDLFRIRQQYYVKILEPLLERFARAQEKGDQEANTEIRRQAHSLTAADARFALLARIALRAILETA
ncbi:MAG: hypothetical protein WAM82_06850 [Thermoanaerobaculia bacterium]